jgi:TonB-linked SusC/RagA family outer membrane protein
MKLVSILCLIGTLQVSALSLAQTTKVTLNLKNTTLKEVFNEIEKTTDFTVFLRMDDVNLNTRVNVVAKDESVFEVLDKVLDNSDLNYTVIDKVIIIKTKDAALQKYSSQAGMQQQALTVTGTVTDHTGEPLPGVNVYEKSNAQNGVITGVDGSYTISVSSRAEFLVFSFIGFEDQEIHVADRKEINVTLVEEVFGLSEVVAIGYGTSKKSDLSASVAVVSGIDQINSRPMTDASSFLQGNVAGVTVVQNGGSPVAGSSVVIRGVGSISNEAPLWVVDGMPYYGGPLNPNDIESMTILKDASAAAVYGAQAASGVIVVTTKRGQSGKPKVNIEASTGVYHATNLPTPLTAQEQSWAYNVATDNAGQGRLTVHDPVQNPWGAINRTNWIDAIFRDAQFNNVSLSISGGTDKSKYMSSFNFQEKEGTLIGTKSEKFIFRLKSEYDITDKITIGENVNITHTDGIGANTSSSYSGAIINAIYMPSAAPVYDEFGNYHGVAPEGSKFAGSYGDVYNPVALLLRPTYSNPVNQANINAYINIDLIEGLKFRSAFALDIKNWENKEFIPRIPESGRRTDMNYLNQNWGNRYLWNWDNQVTYNKSFGDHNFDLTAVYTAQYENYERNNVETQNYAREEDWYHYIKNANELPGWGSGAYEEALNSAIGRLRYDFKSKYFLSASIRKDRTSKLHKDNRSDVFPSVSGAWRISSEPFMEELSWLSNLKLRGSWGKIGNIRSVGSYAYNVPMSSTRGVYLGQDPQFVQSYYVDQQSNPALKWETSETVDFGLDANLFNSKVEVIADYFVKTTHDMILTNAADPHTGVGNGPTSNVGTVENKGYEFTINYRNFDKELKYSVGLNLSSIKNELLDLEGYSSDYIYHSDNVRASLYPYRSEPGQPLYSYHLVPWEGIFNSQAEIDAHQHNGELIQPNAKPGDFKFTDTNKDGVISDEDRVYHGNAFPTFTYALNGHLEYKGFDLSVLLQGVAGVKVFNGYKYSTYAMNEQTYNRDNRILNAWTSDNMNTDIPRLSTLDNNRNFGTNSTWYLEDASYLRLKNLTLGYTLPKDMLNNLLKGSSMRFYLSGENLFTITDYSGIDPEVGGIGFDVGSYPLSMVLTGGLSFSF